MKVKLATQLLSSSIAQALTLCKDFLKLDDFKDYTATINFIQIFNDTFDILNLRTQCTKVSKVQLMILIILIFFHSFKSFICM